MKTVLITGNCGYIGRVMEEVLHAEGWSIVGLDSGYYEGSDRTPRRCRVRQILKDIRELSVSDLSGIDAIVHLAGLSNDPLGDLNPSLTHDINSNPSVRLAHLARKAGISKYLFSSSCSVYGIAENDVPLTETGAVNPLTEYAKSKLYVEERLKELAGPDFHPTYLRNATVYGYSPSMRLDLVANNLTARALIDGEIAILSDGNPWRPLIHVEDLCRAFARVLRAPAESIHNEVFNNGDNNSNFRVREIAETVRKALPQSAVRILNTMPSDERSYRVDFSKFAAAFPDFKPKWTLLAGIEDMISEFSRGGLEKDSINSSRYFRVRWIKKLIEENRLDENLRWQIPTLLRTE